MKILCIIALLLLSGCKSDQIDAGKTYTQQEGLVLVNVATRGSYQFILRANPTDLSSNYLIRNFPDSLRANVLATQSNSMPFAVIYSGVTSSDKDTLYNPAPNDVPIPKGVLPTITLTAIRRKL